MKAPLKPLITIIIPVYNGARFLGQALGSVIAQDYRPIEIIVVDDGSTDDSAAIAESFAEVTCLSQPNQGAWVARNTAISKAKGEFIAFLDADDLWAPNKLTAQAEWLEAHPETGYVTAKYQNFLEEGVARPFWIKPEQLSEIQSGGFANLLVRRVALETIGPFDSTCRRGADLDWVVRGKDAGIKGGVVDMVLMRRRVHDANLSHGWTGGRKLLLNALRGSITRQRSKGEPKG